MHHVGFYQDVEDGFPSASREHLPFLAEQEPCEDSELVALTANYLARGAVLARALGWGRDYFEPTTRTSIDTLTDGEWVWPAHAVHYCERYAIVPPVSTFLARVKQLRGVCPTPSEDQLESVDAEWFGPPDDDLVHLFEDTPNRRSILPIEVDRLDASENAVGSGSGAPPSEIRWALDRLKSVVEPAVGMGKGEQYFLERDASEGLSAAGRSYVAVYRTFFEPGGAVIATPAPNGRYRLLAGDEWVEAARESGVDELPVAVE